MEIARSTAVTFRSNERVRAEQRCVSAGDATWFSCGAAGRHGEPGGEGGVEGVAASARSGSRARRTPQLDVLSSTEQDRLSASTAFSASFKVTACMVVRWG
eukprot:6198960-Pleurochrysis_carterae.AAC.3